MSQSRASELRLVATFGIAVAAATAVLATAFPVYFRMDDVHYLWWAASHPNPFAAFVPSEAALIGMHRPVQNLAWWFLYRLFGMDPTGYQVVVTALHGATLVAFVLLARRLLSPLAGWAALAFHLLAFPSLHQVVFWFSDLTFVLEAFLIIVSLLLLTTGPPRTARIAAGLAFFVLAALAKEPAALIVPSVAAWRLWVAWPDLESRERRLLGATCAVLVVAAATFLLANPHLQTRQDLAGMDPRFLAERWVFYSRELFRGGGAVLAALVAALAARRLLPSGQQSGIAGRWLPPVLAALLVLALRPFPVIDALVLVAAVLVLAFARDSEAPAAVWFLLPLAGLLSIEFTTRTYLFEASFGLVLLGGAAVQQFREDMRLTRVASAARTAVALIVVVVGAALLAPMLGEKLQALRLVSAARQNFRDVVGFIASHRVTDATLVVVDYADMGLDYRNDILPLPDVVKARRQKTMESPDLRVLLRLLGHGEIRVTTLEGFFLMGDRKEAFLFVMNRAEEDFLASAPLRHGAVFESRRSGELAALWRITKLPSCPKPHESPPN